MCFGSTPKVEPIAPSPRQVDNSEAASMKEARDKDRKRQAAVAGYQQNILTGGSGLSDTGVDTKKKLLGE